MKTFALALLIAATGATAQPLLACGHMLVNSEHHNYSQTDIARAACGRDDTCDGKEWNTLFEVVRMSSGPAEWSELRSTGIFCHLGCWGDVDKWNGQCH